MHVLLNDKSIGLNACVANLIKGILTNENVFERNDQIFFNPHGLKIDKYDNIWATDINTHMVTKLNKYGEVLMVLCKKNTPGIWLINDDNSEYQEGGDTDYNVEETDTPSSEESTVKDEDNTEEIIKEEESTKPVGEQYDEDGFLISDPEEDNSEEESSDDGW